MKKKIWGYVAAIIVTVITSILADKLIKIDALDKLLQALARLLGTLLQPVPVPVGLLLLAVAGLLVLVYRRNELTGTLRSLFKPNRRAPIDVHQVLNSPELAEETILRLLGYQNDNPILAYQQNLCNEDYEPGTFTLEEISPAAEFLRVKTTFDAWLDKVIDDELIRIHQIYPSLFKKISNEEVKALARKLMGMRTEFGRPISHEIWYQEYSDIIRRFIAVILNGNPDYEFETYSNLTYNRKQLILKIIDWLEKNKKPDIQQWLHISIASGLMGVDEKSVHAATSEINRSAVISLDTKGLSVENAVERIGERLWDIAHTLTRIDATETFFHTLKSSSGRRFRILSFPDDYIETLFLLRFYSEVLKRYGHVEINLVPRSIRCGNDFSYEDSKYVMKYYPSLQGNPRFHINANGPKIATVNLRKLHPEVMSLLAAADLVDTRGARNYEMMQGVNKETYFGFMVCREISEAVTGLDAADLPLVFLRQPAGDKSFKGFRKRAHRLQNGRMLAEVTALDNKKKWEGGHLSTIRKWDEERRKRYQVTQNFYGENAPYFHGKFGDHLEIDVKSHLDKFKGRVLVLGCGSGKEVNYLARRGCDVCGIDFSDDAIYIAKNLYPHLWNRFYVEDMYNLMLFKEGEFDGIVANAVFVHLLEKNDLQVMLQQINARLKPGGICFIRVIDKEGLNEEYDSHLFDRTRWFSYYRMSDVQKYCQQLKLKVVSKDRTRHTQYPDVYWLSVLIQKNEAVAANG